jgi:hypothetical protein
MPKAFFDSGLRCDMFISAFGKKSQQAKEAINLRKAVRPARITPEPTTRLLPPHKNALPARW